jgi:GST-like protein
MSMTLYAAPMSSAISVVCALAELDVPHELVMLDLASGDQRKADFLALNPNGKVPTLVVDGTPIFEALAIIQWLGDRYGVERGLWPAADEPARLQALAWSTWAYVTFGATLVRLNFAGSERVPAELHHPLQAERCKEELQAMLSLLDDKLADRLYLLGERYSLVDLAVGGAVTYSTYCGVATKDHPWVEAWLARFHERPAFRKGWA